MHEIRPSGGHITSTHWVTSPPIQSSNHMPQKVWLPPPNKTSPAGSPPFPMAPSSWSSNTPSPSVALVQATSLCSSMHSAQRLRPVEDQLATEERRPGHCCYLTVNPSSTGLQHFLRRRIVRAATWGASKQWVGEVKGVAMGKLSGERCREVDSSPRVSTAPIHSMHALTNSHMRDGRCQAHTWTCAHTRKLSRCK